MTVPPLFQLAVSDFDQMLSDARDASDLVSKNQAYTMVHGVLLAFRRRLDLPDAVRFAGVLPPLLRALFVSDWDPDEPRRPFEDRAVMTKEVQALRHDHNFAPDNSIQAVAIALRKNVDEAALDRVLARLPEGARQFWQP